MNPLTKLFVALGLDSSDFERDAENVKRQSRDLGSSIQAAFSGIGGAIATLGKVTAAAGMAVAAGLGAGLVKAVQMGSDAEEMMGKFNVVFGEFAEDSIRDLDAFAAAVGRNKFELRGFAATFQDTFVPMGFAREEAANLSEGLTQLTVDLASFNNMAESDVAAALQSTLVGNHENMLQFGVVINETTLKAELMRMGMDHLTGAALEQAKVQARLNLIYAGTTDAQGDAARTAGGWANTMRRLVSTLQETGTALGAKLLPALTPLLSRFTDWAQVVVPKLGEALGNLASEGIQLLTDAFTTFQQAISGDWVDSDIIHPFHRMVGVIGRLVGAFQSGGLGGLKEEFLSLLPPDVVSQIESAFSFLRENFETIKSAAIGLVTAFAGFTIFTTVAGWIAGLVAAWGTMSAAISAAGGIIAAVVAVLGGPITIALAALAAAVGLLAVAWTNNWGGIQEKVAAAWAIIQPALQQLWAWLAESIPAAVQATTDFWNNNLLPALQQLGAWWYAQALPALQELAMWLGETLVATFAVLKDAWDTVLYPALSAFWAFLRDDLLPLNEALNRVLVEIRDVAAVAVKAAWDNYLQPALKGLWDKLTEADKATKSLLTPLDELREMAEGALATALNTLGKGALNFIISEFGRLKEFIQGIIGLLNTMAEKIASIKPPNLGGGGGSNEGKQSTSVKPHNAGGTKSFAGGLTWVGEQGKELVNLPRGTEIMSNNQSRALMAGVMGGNQTNTYHITVNTPVDLEALYYQLGEMRQERGGA